MRAMYPGQRILNRPAILSRADGLPVTASGKRADDLHDGRFVVERWGINTNIRPTKRKRWLKDLKCPMEAEFRLVNKRRADCVIVRQRKDPISGPCWVREARHWRATNIRCR